MKVIELKPLLKPVQDGVSIPSSKSYTNRALFIAALSGSKVKITNPLISDDTQAMVDCLKSLGVSILEKQDYLEVFCNLGKIPNRSYNLNANLSGTTLRFLLALSTIIPGIKTLSGREGLNKRPIKDLVSGLTQLGAKIEHLNKKGYPPVKILSSKLNPGTIKIKGSVSSQYISALLMIAPLIGETIIEILGEQISKPYIDMTIDIMKIFGVTLSNEKYKKYVIPASQKYKIAEFSIEGDTSSASYFFAIAALTKSVLTVKNINPNSKQADIVFLKILEKMGNGITYGKNQITIHGKGVKPINANMQDCPDQVQTLAVLAAFANGITKISGVQSLRLKETNRIFALKKELKKMGIAIYSTRNTLTIHGGHPKPARIDTYGDHRMAMSFAIAGSLLSGVKIIDPDVVNKTFPQFFEKLNSIGIKTKAVDSKNIVLIGMRGSGKTTIAKLLAAKLNKQYLELDEMIVEKAGLTIEKIVEKHGWEYFRKKESQIVQEISSTNGKIISTGGGVILKAANVDALKRNGILIFLNASLKTLVKRMGNNLHRPALTSRKTLKEEIEKVLKQRTKLYEKAADKIIDTDKLDPEKTANLILSKLI
ncbi:3-phosphoshikimate 1-carboxyvinyltransferase [Patescibacteria group bacterium]|nr:3-phosphoshikimate 1-carboxyvinyltransferase [Patescibacteria group bacterium]